MNILLNQGKLQGEKEEFFRYQEISNRIGSKDLEDWLKNFERILT